MAPHHHRQMGVLVPDGLMPVRPTPEADEQGGAIRCGAGGAKGGGQGECAAAKHGPDTELGNRVTGAGAHTASSKAKEEGKVHRAPPPHQQRQMGVLVPDGLMPVGPTPICNRRQRAGVTALGRYLPHHILACPRLAPRVGKSEEGERGTIRLRMVSTPYILPISHVWLR